MIDNKQLKNELHSISTDYLVEDGKNVVWSDNYVFEVFVDLNVSEKCLGVGGSPHAEIVLMVDDFEISDLNMYDGDGDYVELNPFQKEIAHQYLLHTLKIEE